MNKAIGVAVWALFGLLGCTTPAPIPSPLESQEAQQALALMQTPPVERHGRNMWAALITAKQSNLTPEQRQKLADDYVTEFNHWYATTYVDWYLEQDVFKQVSLSEPSSEPKPPLPPGDRQWPAVAGNKALCFSTNIFDCLKIVRDQPQATQEALAPHMDLLEQVAELAEYDYYHTPLQPGINTPIPPFQHLFLPLSAHALNHVNGDSDQALMGLCRDANTARVLFRDSNDLIAVMVAASMLRNNLHVAAQVIAELPLDTALPASCDTAFAPLTAQDINLSLCSGMRAEFASLHSFIELLKKQIIHSQILSENEHVSDLDNVHLVSAYDKAAVCWPQMQQALLKDEKFLAPPVDASISTWLQQCPKLKHNGIPYGLSCALSQIGGADYADYVHRMQDLAAQLQIMQALLWLRQQPNLPQPLTNDYLQAAVPANIYASTQRPLVLSEDGSELKIPVYEKRPRDPCNCVRLSLPQALRDAR